MGKKVKTEYPLGSILYCEVYYQIEYVGGFQYESSTTVLQAQYSPGLPGLPPCVELAVNAAQSARTVLWDAWVDFRNEKEKDKKVERLIVQKTEYWTNLNTDKKFVTAFIDKFVRAIPGSSFIPANF